jgi:hypothetical protein
MMKVWMLVEAGDSEAIDVFLYDEDGSARSRNVLTPSQTGVACYAWPR